MDYIIYELYYRCNSLTIRLPRDAATAQRKMSGPTGIKKHVIITASTPIGLPKYKFIMKYR